MYVKRIQINNYGPIDRLDISFPFEGDAPKPVVLVGENGSGKSIALSHIVNGLIAAKDSIYLDTPEVDTNKVYKLRSNSYIKPGSECYFARVDFFDDNLFIEEMRIRRPKKEHSDIPAELSGVDAHNAWKNWEQISADQHDYFNSNIPPQNNDTIKAVLSKNCVLYFPPNRFEDPAWLNEENLKAKAQYMDLTYTTGHTSRKIIQYSPLRDNQNWLFDVIYDMTAFEGKTVNFPLRAPSGNQQGNQSVSLPLFLGHSGNTTNMYNIAIQIVRIILQRGSNLRFGIGRRLNRMVSIMENEQTLTPNIFQLSSGETALLNLFLSTLKDFDLCDASFTKAEDIRGIVVVDEIDLHLHAVHQYRILPALMKMFPRVQFVVTTHSPLFVLGLKNTFGENRFAVYRLPQGEPIAPEAFSEFEHAYQAFTTTSAFQTDIQKEIENTQKPIVFVEGTTDATYLRRAAELLGRNSMLENIDIRAVDGKGRLKNIWNTIRSLRSLPSDLVPQKVIILHDPEYEGEPADKGNMFKQKIPQHPNHPIAKGIEHLFSEATLKKAITDKPEFIDIEDAHQKTMRGRPEEVPEQWTIAKDEKTNLCDWLCKHGTKEDFQYFSDIFEILEQILGTGAVTA